MNKVSASAHRPSILSPVEVLLIVVLISSTVGVVWYVHNTLIQLSRSLPAEIVRQSGDLNLLVQELVELTHIADLALLEPLPQHREALLIHTRALRDQLAAMRAGYVFDDLVGAAAIHAMINPASQDIQRWLSEGLPGFAPNSPTIMQLVEVRARDALMRARDLSLQGSSTALALLNQGSVRLDAFRGGVLFMLVSLITLALAVMGLLFGRQRAAAHLASLREQLADAIDNIPEGFILCDASDRVVVCNEQYRRMCAGLSDVAVPGMPFVELARAFFRDRPVVDDRHDEEQMLAERMARHCNPGELFEYELRDGRRIRISERRTRNGGVVGIYADMTDVRRTQERLHYLATHDVLTGLPNRAYCQEHLERIIVQAHRNRTRFAILYLDLDRFKIINDTLGHHAGDELLRAVAKRLRSQLRDGDILARLGGDEFMTILVDALVDLDFAEVFARRLIGALSEPFSIVSNEVFVSTSIGIAQFPAHGGDIETLMRNADVASYQAKSQGPNNACLYTPELEVRFLERLKREHDVPRP